MKVNCKYCGKEFTPHASSISRGYAKYCSRKCYWDSHPRKVEFHCACCGKQIMKLASQVKNPLRVCCSPKCAHQIKKLMVQCKCKYCGGDFIVHKSELDRGGGKYCSPKCAYDGMSGAGSPHWKGGGRKGGKEAYGDNWRQQRKLAFIRDGGVCQYCHCKPKKGEPQNCVHHIRPRREFVVNGVFDYLAANDLSNLITLCKSCHPKAEHGAIPVPRRLF